MARREYPRARVWPSCKLLQRQRNDARTKIVRKKQSACEDGRPQGTKGQRLGAYLIPVPLHHVNIRCQVLEVVIDLRLLGPQVARAQHMLDLPRHLVTREKKRKRGR